MKKRLFLNEKAMLAVVLLNVLVIFLQGCGLENAVMGALDILCTMLFIIEMVVKHHEYGLRGYWGNGWNVLDGVVTLVTLPSLMIYFMPDFWDLKIFITFRALRVFKFFRAARHFPNLPVIWKGFTLALRQSAGFLLGYFIIIVVIAMFNSALFSKAAPQYFSTPLDAIYSVFQLFTVEGWYEIPNAVVGDMHPVWIHVVRTYFCLLLIGGGIIGMSFINSIFVDALATDNNDEVKAQLNSMEQKIEENQKRLEQELDDLKKLIEKQS